MNKILLLIAGHFLLLSTHLTLQAYTWAFCVNCSQTRISSSPPSPPGLLSSALPTASPEPFIWIPLSRNSTIFRPRLYAKHRGMWLGVGPPGSGAGPRAALPHPAAAAAPRAGAPLGLRSREPGGARLPVLADPGAPQDGTPPRAGLRRAPAHSQCSRVPRVTKPGLAAPATQRGCSRWNRAGPSAAGTRTRASAATSRPRRRRVRLPPHAAVM